MGTPRKVVIDGQEEGEKRHAKYFNPYQRNYDADDDDNDDDDDINDNNNEDGN